MLSGWATSPEEGAQSSIEATYNRLHLHRIKTPRRGVRQAVITILGLYKGTVQVPPTDAGRIWLPGVPVLVP
jgi:hypothetical protein